MNPAPTRDTSPSPSVHARLDAPWRPEVYRAAVLESDLPQMTRFVAVLLGDHADRNGHTIHSVLDMAHWTELSPYGVRYHLARLLRRGWLVGVGYVGPRAGPGRVRVYRLLIPGGGE